MISWKQVLDITLLFVLLWKCTFWCRRMWRGGCCQKKRGIINLQFWLKWLKIKSSSNTACMLHLPGLQLILTSTKSTMREIRIDRLIYLSNLLIWCIKIIKEISIGKKYQYVYINDTSWWELAQMSLWFWWFLFPHPLDYKQNTINKIKWKGLMTQIMIYITPI